MDRTTILLTLTMEARFSLKDTKDRRYLLASSFSAKPKRFKKAYRIQERMKIRRKFSAVSYRQVNEQASWKANQVKLISPNRQEGWQR
jgi:hypothetical protein